MKPAPLPRTLVLLETADNYPKAGAGMIDLAAAADLPVERIRWTRTRNPGWDAEWHGLSGVVYGGEWRVWFKSQYMAGGKAKDEREAKAIAAKAMRLINAAVRLSSEPE